MTYTKHTIYLIIIFAFFASCQNNGVESELDKSSIEIIDNVEIPDTLSAFLEKIHASDKAKDFDEYFSHLNRAGIFNGNVLIAQQGVIIYEKCFGYSDIRQKDSLQLDSKFQIASVSKQFTAVAILQLYEKGLLDLQDTIQKFFPDFPYKDITIHLLLTHKSGLPNYIYLCDRNFNSKDSGAVSNNQAIACLTQLKPGRYFRPGRRFDYSNTGYMILASIVEKVTHTKFDKYVKQNIFEPLGMSNSFIYVKGKTIFPEQTTKGYIHRRTLAEDIFLNGVYGDKGVYSSVEDLYKWDQGLYKNIIISDTILNLAFQPMGKRKWAYKNYGYGWRMFDSKKAGKVLYHAGWWYGYQSLLVRIPKDSSTIVVLKNRKTKGIIDQGRLFDILYKKYEFEGKSSI